MNIKSQNQAVGTIVIAIETAMANENLTAAQSLFGHLRKAISPYEYGDHDAAIVVEGWQSEEDRLQKEYTDQMLRYKIDSGLWIEDDGGRKAAGFEGRVGDCCVRAVAISMEKAYKEVWDLFMRLSEVNPDNGVSHIHVCNVIAEDGWTRQYYSNGEQVIDVIPQKGKAIVWCRFLDGLHAVAAVDGIIRDSWNSLGLEVLWVATPPDEA